MVFPSLIDWGWLQPRLYNVDYIHCFTDSDECGYSHALFLGPSKMYLLSETSSRSPCA